jgi:glutamate racemase
MARASDIDTIVLGCTHYPLLEKKIRQYLPERVQLLSQGSIVAGSLADYLHRHPEIEAVCAKGGQTQYFTTESPEDFDFKAAIFLGEKVRSRRALLER